VNDPRPGRSRNHSEEGEGSEDARATEPPAESTPETPAGQPGGGEEGGPLGNPDVDEEALRKRQEESGGDRG
jgi:hypothetical protein